MENEIMYIKLDDIIPNRFQPREVFDEESLQKLADSIKQHGVIEPILVRPVSNKYEIIAGERRYKASVLAGLTKIPAMVRQLDDKESSIIAFIENEHRNDVSAIEEARTMDRILNNNNMTQEELAKELGVNQSTIANKLRLLNLPMEVQDALMHNQISERHARSLLSVKDENKQIELLNKIKEKKMSVRELDSEIKNMNENMNFYNESTNNLNGLNNPNPMNGGMPGVDNSFNPNPGLNGPLPGAGMPPLEPPKENPVNNDFMSYLNGFDNTPPAPSTGEPLPPMGPAAPIDLPPLGQEPANNDFMSYLNNFDNTPAPGPAESVPPMGPVPMEQPAVDLPPLGQEPASNDFMSYLNNYDNQAPAPGPTEAVPPMGPVPMEQPAVDLPPLGQESANNDFMSYLNNYDNPSSAPNAGEPLPSMDLPPLNQQPEPPINNDFMSYLNNYDNQAPVAGPREPLPPMGPAPMEQPTVDLPPLETPAVPVAPTEPQMDYNEATTQFTPINPDYLTSEPNSNVTLNNVTPPVTSGSANGYVEDNENYVDITKQEKITDVKTVISKLGTVINEIKEKSVFKVDTEEIDFDDLYQITIKIDKRDF